MDSLRAFALEQLMQTAALMSDESLSQLDYEQLRLDYERLLELCLFHVLVPQGDKQAAQHLLQADSVLTVEKKTVARRRRTPRRFVCSADTLRTCAPHIVVF